jgi:hypothetical protein
MPDVSVSLSQNRVTGELRRGRYETVGKDLQGLSKLGKMYAKIGYVRKEEQMEALLGDF